MKLYWKKIKQYFWKIKRTEIKSKNIGGFLQFKQRFENMSLKISLEYLIEKIIF